MLFFLLNWRWLLIFFSCFKRTNTGPSYSNTTMRTVNFPASIINTWLLLRCLDWKPERHWSYFHIFSIVTDLFLYKWWIVMICIELCFKSGVISCLLLALPWKWFFKNRFLLLLGFDHICWKKTWIIILHASYNFWIFFLLIFFIFDNLRNFCSYLIILTWLRVIFFRRLFILRCSPSRLICCLKVVILGVCKFIITWKGLGWKIFWI